MRDGQASLTNIQNIDNLKFKMFIILPASLIIKRSIIILFVAAAYFLITQPVNGMESTPTSNIKKDTVRGKVEEKRLMAQERIEVKRTEIASRAAALREKLQTFRDKLKAQIVQKVSDTLNRINKKQTEQMQKHLDKMSSMVTRLEKRVNEATGSSNTASASAAVSNAKSAIASASTAVAVQMANDYTINISTESAARVESKQARDRLHNDLRSVRRLVIDAKKAVSNAIRIIATSLGGIKSGQ